MRFILNRKSKSRYILSITFGRHLSLGSIHISDFSFDLYFAFVGFHIIYGGIPIWDKE
jgi:hypothetical protein